MRHLTAKYPSLSTLRKRLHADLPTEEWRAVVDYLAKAGLAGVRELIVFLVDEQKPLNRRSQVGDVLRTISLEAEAAVSEAADTVPALAQILEEDRDPIDPRPDLRAAAAKALALIGGNAPELAVPALKKALRQQDRSSLLDELLRTLKVYGPAIRDQEIVESLASLVQHSSDEAIGRSAAAAIRAIHEHCPWTVLRLLARGLQSPCAWIRVEIAETIGVVGRSHPEALESTPNVLCALASAATTDPDFHARKSALFTLNQLSSILVQRSSQQSDHDTQSQPFHATATKASLAEVERDLDAILDSLHRSRESVRRRIERLVRKLAQASSPDDSFETKRRLASKVDHLLRVLDLQPLCPSTGEPAALRVNKAGKGQVLYRFQVIQINIDRGKAKKRTYKDSSKTFPCFAVTERPSSSDQPDA